MCRNYSLMHGRWFYSLLQGQKHSNCYGVRKSIFIVNHFLTVPLSLLFTVHFADMCCLNLELGAMFELWTDHWFVWWGFFFSQNGSCNVPFCFRDARERVALI